jgi:chemotaxis protein histidine kinase CheA
LGGDIMIFSRPGSGTTIAVKVPVKRIAAGVVT